VDSLVYNLSCAPRSLWVVRSARQPPNSTTRSRLSRACVCRLACFAVWPALFIIYGVSCTFSYARLVFAFDGSDAFSLFFKPLMKFRFQVSLCHYIDMSGTSYYWFEYGHKTRSDLSLPSCSLQILLPCLSYLVRYTWRFLVFAHLV